MKVISKVRLEVLKTHHSNINSGHQYCRSSEKSGREDPVLLETWSSRKNREELISSPNNYTIIKFQEALGRTPSCEGPQCFDVT